MGVIGLWNLIEDSGGKVNVETLRGKVLAVDLSIWINQSIKGFRDKNGSAVENAHILGLFYRVCKLLYYNIKPIFVFDGDCPTLKSRTLAKRQEKTRKALARSKNISLNVLEKYLNSKFASTDIPNALLAAMAKNKLRFAEKNLLSELFLPPKSDSRQVDIYQEFVELSKQLRNSVSDDSDSDNCYTEKRRNKDDIDDEDSSFNVPNSQNIRDIDINSASFKSLPATTRYEILVELRESYKGRKNPFPEMLPSNADEFSQFQMKKLLKKRTLQEEIDSLIDELNGISGEENIDLLTRSSKFAKLVESNFSQNIATGRLASDAATRFLLLKSTSTIDNEISRKNENRCSNDNDEKKDYGEENAEHHMTISTQNLAYHLPNSIVDMAKGEESQILGDMNRIEHLSQASSSSTSNGDSNRLQSKQLSGHLNNNVKKLIATSSTDTSKNNSTLCLSDVDSSTDSDDFVEVESTTSLQSLFPDSLQENFHNDKVNALEESLELPYETNYEMDIFVENENDSVQFLSKSESSDHQFMENRKEEFALTTTIALCQDDDLSEAETSQEISSETISNSAKSDDIHGSAIDEIISIPISKKEENISATAINDHSVDERASNQEEEIILLGQKNLSKNTAIKSGTVAETMTEKPLTIDEMIEQRQESNKIARQAASVSRQMVNDCQELLRLFGVPWVMAPAEAEAQCAELETLELCEGTITDDSDIFLFGGRQVFRHFFSSANSSNAKYITKYQAEDLEKYYGLDRCKLICLAMLCGTDYTFGIDGIGPVTGLELLSEFPGERMQPLERFAEWYRGKLTAECHSARPENAIRAKLLKFTVPPNFPNRVIFDAYHDANVDDSRQPFRWSSPQLSELRKFAHAKFGWPEAKADSLLLPVLKTLNEKQKQAKIDFFFSATSKNLCIAEKLQIKRSKRLNEAIRRNLHLQQQQQQQPQEKSASSNESSKRTKRSVNKRKIPESTKSIKSSKASSVVSNALVLSEESSTDDDSDN